MFSRTSSRLISNQNIVYFATPKSAHHKATSTARFFNPGFPLTRPHSRDSNIRQHWQRKYKFQSLEASSWTTAVVVTAAIGGTVAVSLLFQRPSGATTDVGVEKDTPVQEPSYLDMPGNTAPGHLGNLTAEQEAKLREFWGATLRVFGVQPPANAESAASEAVEEAVAGEGEVPGATQDKQKSKKRLGIFRSKKDKDSKDPKEAAGSPLTPGSPASLEDDKYGQTKEFHDTLANSTPEELRAAFWSMVKADHPDVLLLRFLRARKWDVERALIMLVSTMRWRAKDVHVDDDIIANGEPVALETSKSSDKAAAKEAEDFLTQMRMGKSFLHGCDKEGRPLCHVRVRLHKQGEQSETALERYTVFTIETARYMLVPPVETAVSCSLYSIDPYLSPVPLSLTRGFQCIIFDMSNFTLANMDYTPVKFMIKCFEANYPESLGAVLVHKAPWIFQGIWKIIRGWLDPVVAAKIHFTTTVEDLEQYIPKSNIIKELGGGDPFEYKYVEPDPISEKTLSTQDASHHQKRDSLLHDRAQTVLEFQNKTFEWLSSASSSTSDSSSSIKAERDGLAKSLRTGYWDIDPYIRAGSYYDRVGVIGKGGVVNFYPERNKTTTDASKPSPANGAAVTPGESNADDVD